MPFRLIKLKAQKPDLLDDLDESLGSHLRRVRKERGLKQTDAARLLGINEHSVVSWEAGKQPHVRMYPDIISFLGYEPLPEPDTLAKRLIAERRRRGLSAKRVAKLFGVDEGTWGRWERGMLPVRVAHDAVIENFLARPYVHHGTDEPTALPDNR